MGKLIKIICFVISFTLAYGNALKFDGDIISRNDNEIKCSIFKDFESVRSIRAQVFTKNKIVFLPGTKQSIISEWIKAGEIECLPSKSNVLKAKIINENTAGIINRGAKFILLPNRPPEISKITMDSNLVDPGNRLFVKLFVADPENDGFQINWLCDKGHWINETTRSNYNFYIAPLEKGDIKLSFKAFDVYGEYTLKEKTITVKDTPSSDLYKLQHTMVGPLITSHASYDAIVNNKGNIYILKKSSIYIYSPQGIFIIRIKNIFNNALKLHVDLNNYIYVLDYEEKTIYKTNQDGKILKTFKDLSDQGDIIEINAPIDFVVSEDDRVFLLDQELARIIIFNEQGILTGAIGAKGNKEGQFILPKAIEIGNEGQLFILDSGALKVKIFDKHYKFIKDIKLTERFSYKDIAIDFVTNTLYIFGMLQAKNQGFFIKHNLNNSTSKTYSIEGINVNDIKSTSIDLDGNILITTLKVGPTLKINPIGKLIGQFLQENPNRYSKIASGPLGTIYFESGKKIKRLNYFGWIDRVYDNVGNIISMVVDKDENLYIINKGVNKIKIYSKQAQHIKDILLAPTQRSSTSKTSNVISDKIMSLTSRDKIYGIGVDDEKKVYVLHTPSHISIYSPKGEPIKKVDLNSLDVKGMHEKMKIFPPSLFQVDKSGTAYIVDKLKKNIIIFKNNFSKNYVFKGQFKKISDITVDSYLNLYVLDLYKKSILKYNKDDQLKRDINLKQNMKKPTKVTAFGNGEIAIFDETMRKLFIYK